MQANDTGFLDKSQSHSGPGYLAPADLSVSPAPLKRILFVGACFLELLEIHKRNGLAADFILTGGMQLPDEPPREIASYEFQVVQIALRSVMHDATLWSIAYHDIDGYRRALEERKQQLAVLLRSILRWNVQHGILTFVCNFMLPQQDSTGRLFPRYDIRNIAFFVEQLNVELERLIASYDNVYLLDIDKISASLGRRYIQDDGVEVTAHGAVLQLFGADPWERIDPVRPMAEHYRVRWPAEFPDAVWAEVQAMYRTVRQIDAVKLVVVDLDDTLWIGVSGDKSDVGPDMTEGWPLGIIEALQYLKKRGTLLAVISKNDANRVAAIWDRIFAGKLRRDDFAAVLVNWQPKPENMAQLLRDVNLLPRNVVFIDDSPVERSAMKNAFPEMRILGRYPYYLRRILLWSAETQVAAITPESAQRNEMVDRKSTRLNSSHIQKSRMPSSA